MKSSPGRSWEISRSSDLLCRELRFRGLGSLKLRLRELTSFVVTFLEFRFPELKFRELRPLELGSLELRSRELSGELRSLELISGESEVITPLAETSLTIGRLFANRLSGGGAGAIILSGFGGRFGGRVVLDVFQAWGLEMSVLLSSSCCDPGSLSSRDGVFEWCAVLVLVDWGYDGPLSLICRLSKASVE